MTRNRQCATFEFQQPLDSTQKKQLKAEGEKGSKGRKKGKDDGMEGE